MTKVAYTTKERAGESPGVEASWLRQVVLDAGADDVGFVSIARTEVDQDREDILWAFPGAKTLVTFVCSMNRDAIRSPARSVANLEFHQAGHDVDDVARRVIAALRERGHGGINPAMGFPMEMDRFPGKIWVISHKKIAEAAGLGTMGIHRNVIHPKLGNFILLGTVITDAEVNEESRPLDYSPCLECKLCVAACPVGAIKPNGAFDFSACYTHNYREFMGGFTDLVETIAASNGAKDFRTRVTDAEGASWWQSLSFGANYKAAYCMAVCPAGEDIIGQYLRRKKAFNVEVLKPLQQKVEPVYVVADTDAEAHVARRFPHKTVRRVGNTLRPVTVSGFLDALPIVFQRGVATKLELSATYHFTFTGSEQLAATVRIEGPELTVRHGLHGDADIGVTVDAQTWLDILKKDRGTLGAVLTRKLRVRGPLRLMKQFAACFPG